MKRISNFFLILHTPVFSLCGFVFLLSVSFFLFPNSVFAGAYLLAPTTGTFTVGSTFDVQVLLDTEGESVNALDVDLLFPPDKLQLVSPKTSVSVIEVWTSQPKFNNQSGYVRLQGGIPNGVNVDNALVATLTFRVKSVGNAILRFGDESKILLNDGLGTNDLRKQGSAVYKLVLPPPLGPTVVSETHPNQGTWYSNSNAVLKWSTVDPVENYSYILDRNPISVPDDTPDGKQESVIYKSLPDGQQYFHIKTYRNGGWGGVTHFALAIDTEGPAQFPIEILPRPRTTVRDPVMKFQTTDTLSGIDHYEIKIVSLHPFVANASERDEQDLFIETESPYVSPTQEVGPYDVIVRAYDKAGNIREVSSRLTITNKFLSWSSDEGLILGSILISWPWLLLFLALFILFLIFVAFQMKHRHDLVAARRVARDLPDTVQHQLEELRRYKNKYGSMAAFILLFSFSLFASPVFAAEERGGVVELAPPYVTTVSKDVSNNEIFYVGGKTENKNTIVIIYTQNLTTGETTSYEVESDKKGEWFYRHNSFLSSGKYVIWTQAKIGDITSPPSPQIEMSVERAAITFGVTRIGYESLFAIIAGLLLLIIFILVWYILYHAYQRKTKHKVLLKEIREAEESIKRGFAVLRRDIERELQTIKGSSLYGSLGEEEKRREDELYRDLKDIERRIGKEVWDIERAEQG